MVVAAVLYLFLCVVVGLAGRRRRPGFTGYVLLALFLTPILPLIFLLFTQKRFLEAEAAKKIYMKRFVEAEAAKRFHTKGPA
jgi:hypothetical protein